MARDELVEAFKDQYASIAALKRNISRKIVCGAASRQLLSKALQLRQEKAGLFLQTIKAIKKNINVLESEDDFGEKFHTVAYEPYFYESAYCHYKVQ